MLCSSAHLRSPIPRSCHTLRPKFRPTHRPLCRPPSNLSYPILPIVLIFPSSSLLPFLSSYLSPPYPSPLNPSPLPPTLRLHTLATPFSPSLPAISFLLSPIIFLFPFCLVLFRPPCYPTLPCPSSIPLIFLQFTHLSFPFPSATFSSSPFPSSCAPSLPSGMLFLLKAPSVGTAFANPISSSP